MIFTAFSAGESAIKCGISAKFVLRFHSPVHSSGENAAPLPPQIGSLPLSALDVSKNVFSGEIPEEIGTLRRLQLLDLSYNNFSGEFPGSLSSLN
ncbi:UNVERIFIED_CONTAM: hypothetical protein Scaly_1083800 [Sesamum calycinum]|uniref:Uncharacterized protein n=1 Tax=Sesamum calycinum TaxID=2727403 RepID=A0AAW2QLV2_9LAMI